MNDNVRFFIIGLQLYIYPPEPQFGDLKALHEWKPIKFGTKSNFQLNEIIYEAVLYKR